MEIKKNHEHVLYRGEVNKTSSRLVPCLEVEETLFTDNAFLFLENCDRILKDSRMSMCPIPVHNTMVYLGTYGVENPTLGVYVEWWKECAVSTIMGKNHEPWLVYRISGSMLTGCNACGLVNADGVTTIKWIDSFEEAWRSFRNVNHRYEDEKGQQDAYTLVEVLDIFNREGRMEVVRPGCAYTYIMEHAHENLNKSMEGKEAKIARLQERVHRLLMSAKRDDLKQLMEEYNKMKKSQYDLLGSNKRNSSYDFRVYKDRVIQSLFPNEGITFEEIKEFILEIENQ